MCIYEENSNLYNEIYVKKYRMNEQSGLIHFYAFMLYLYKLYCPIECQLQCVIMIFSIESGNVIVLVYVAHSSLSLLYKQK